VVNPSAPPVRAQVMLPDDTVKLQTRK